VLERVLASFAHDVRTPLTGILALSELLATSELGEREREWVGALKSSAEHLAALATLVVDGARSSARGLVLRPDVFDLRALSDDMAAALSARAQAKGLEATVSIAPDLPRHVRGDQVRLRAAVENLLDNAVKFTEAGQVRFEVARASGRTAHGRLGVVFAMSDSGIGMTLAQIRRLFRPFAQASAAVAEKFGGPASGSPSSSASPRRWGATSRCRAGPAAAARFGCR
jgi:signal transduction histidine kinase